MPEKSTYSTKARVAVLNCFENLGDGTVSAAELISRLHKDGVSVNPATVYRCLNRLCAEKLLLKFTEEATQKAVYRFVGSGGGCDEHIHIKCKLCGRVLHLDCGLMREIREHLATDHGFELCCDGSVLYGICDECGSRQK